MDMAENNDLHKSVECMGDMRSLLTLEMLLPKPNNGRVENEEPISLVLFSTSWNPGYWDSSDGSQDFGVDSGDELYHQGMKCCELCLDGPPIQSNSPGWSMRCMSK